ncbi:hypothetical protein NUW54_g12442 [Trametes sanguinea]|uniref:Uncharacterized protein n=1 Tax=Trametes sanguinea TaxID=158606 RepID=A0ACC1MYJ9_9APHY|nr:hypothetical protein NUW54_g12442 [Trametes sanguinea]
MSEDGLARLRSPRQARIETSAMERLALRMFTARGDASEENFADNRAAFMEFLPDAAVPTYEQVKRLSVASPALTRSAPTCARTPAWPTLGHSRSSSSVHSVGSRATIPGNWHMGDSHGRVSHREGKDGVAEIHRPNIEGQQRYGVWKRT